MPSVYSRQYQQFLKKILQARRDSGMTQVQVAGKLGKPQSFVAKFEAGERRLDFVEVQHLAAIYRKPITFFET